MTRREREVTDINDILQIINETKILHLGLSCMSVSSVLDSYPLMLLHSLRNFLEWK